MMNKAFPQYGLGRGYVVMGFHGAGKAQEGFSVMRIQF
jgi:hypothetical protein